MLFFIAGDAADPSSVLNNGTVSFVDTGSAKLLVTCARNQGIPMRKEPSILRCSCRCGSVRQGHVLAIHEESIIDCGDDRLDLATLHLTNLEELQSIGKGMQPRIRLSQRRELYGHPAFCGCRKLRSELNRSLLQI